MRLADLQALAAAGPERLARLTELAARLDALDKERAAIIAGLAEMGVTEEAPLAEQPALPLRRALANPLCAACEDPGEVNVNGQWYCVEHDPLKE